MGRTIQDLIREQRNAASEATGKKADAAAASKINVGDLGAAGRANVARRSGTAGTRPKPKAGVRFGSFSAE